MTVLPTSPPDGTPRASTSSAHSLDLPSLQPLSHDHPLLSSSSFDVDAFLLSRIHIPLDELRGELRSYLADLREELVQLINDDYEEFISLGTGLRGEGERLRRLEKPLKGLSEEVDSVRGVLIKHQEAVQQKLEERAALREERALLDLLQRLFETLARAESLLTQNDDDDRGKVVSRVAGEYTQLVYLLKKARAEGCTIVDTVTDRIERIKRRLSEDLSVLLIDALEGPTLKLQQCLKTYELIEGWNEAEEVLRRVLRDFCRVTITSSALLVSSSPMVPLTPHPSSNPFDKTVRLPDSSPLASLLNRVLFYIEGYAPLMAASAEVSDHFDFFSRVVWPVICEAISENLGQVIFAAGRPEELHEHYTTTHRFVGLLETLAPSSRAVIAMRESESYAAFERRWQLPVYYQLRWKEIVSGFEASLTTPGTTGEWALPQTAAAWKALQTCWDDDVYVPELANRFWRLSLQIVARYSSWLKSTVDGYTADEEGPGEDAALRTAAAAVMDLDKLRAKTIELKPVKAIGIDPLTIPTTLYENTLITILTRRCGESLKLVRSVASQFRAAPSKSTDVTPSYFVSSILAPLHTLYTSRPALKAAHGTEWSTRIIDQVLTTYAGILSSVRKTEDLLRRHRKSKKTGFSLFGSASSGAGEGEDQEEERFRTQMRVDMNALKKDAKGLGVDVGALPGWKELEEVVERPGE